MSLSTSWSTQQRCGGNANEGFSPRLCNSWSDIFTIWPPTTSLHLLPTYLGLSLTIQRCRLGDVNEGVSPVLCNFWSDIFIILSSVTSSATYPRLTPNIQRCIPGNATAMRGFHLLCTLCCSGGGANHAFGLRTSSRSNISSPECKGNSFGKEWWRWFHHQSVAADNYRSWEDFFAEHILNFDPFWNIS